MNYESIVPDAFVRALGWALAHALWQAAAVALLLSLVLPRLSSARQRYRAAYGALLLVFAAASATLWYCYETPAPTWVSVDLSDGAAASDQLIAAPGATPFEIWATAQIWLETHHALVVALWLLGFAFFILRLAAGLWQIRRLRTRGLRLPAPEWQDEFRRLQALLGMSGKAALWESARIQAPMAFGWLKPVVLLPIGLINRLSPAEVEAVIAHELAHIARRDWIFNLLQAFIESLFYYHPAVWWMSSVIRRERENCCDDDALRATGNPLAFAKALVQVQEMATPVPALAMAWSRSRRRPLLERVRRILNQPSQQQHQVMEKITATFFLLAMLALVGLKANSVPTLEAALSKISEIPSLWLDQPETETVADSLPPKAKSIQKITREEDNRRVEAEYQDGKLTRLNIDGKEIPAAEFAEHEEMIEMLQEDMEAPEATEMPELPETPEPPSFPGSQIRLFKDKDSDGNTIIRLDNAGEPTEVVIKGSDVYVNGEKLEEGQSLDIPNTFFNFDGMNFVLPEGADAHEFNFSFGDGSSEGGADAEHLAKLNAEMAERRSELDQEIKEKMEQFYSNRKDMKKDMERARKEMKESQKEWKKSQKEWKKNQDNWAKEQKIWAENQQIWAQNQEKMQAAQLEMQAKNQAMLEGLKRELLSDKLIDDPEKFNLQLNEKSMKVNGKVQPEAIRKKYLELVESISGEKLKGNASFNYNFSKN